MCLIVFAWQAHPRYKLVMAANRDEFYERPTQAAHFWPPDGQILAGKDLEAGGTWLGLTRQGRFAALTNYRDPAQFGRKARSRGLLPTNYLTGDQAPLAYLQNIESQANSYNGFNLLVGNGHSLAYYSNYEGQARELPPGLYGLSNHLLNSPWFKVEQAKNALAPLLQADTIGHEQLLALLLNPAPAPEGQVQQTGLPPEREQMLSPMFIRSPQYGTCSTTALLINHQGHALFAEQNHNPLQAKGAISIFEFTISP